MISVIIPVYNVERELCKCIDSCLSQSFDDIELILVDDGSLDKSGAICEEYASRYQNVICVHKENGGLSDARNAGIKLARGEYVAFIDSDDFIYPRYFEFLGRIISQQDADISVCAERIEKHTYLFNENLELKSDGVLALDTEEALRELLYGRISVSACGKLYKRSLFDSIMYPIGKHFEDVSTTCLVFLKASRIVVSDEKLYCYAMREGSISHQKLNEHSFDRYDLACEATEVIKKKYGEAFLGACRRYRVVHALSVLRLDSDCDDNKYERKIKGLRHYVRENTISVLCDSDAQRRDKFGVIANILGRRPYLACWKLYQNMRSL